MSAVAAPGAPPALVEARDLKKYFAIRGGIAGRTVGFVRAVDGVDLTIARGKTVGLIGESGCGKTTVGRCLLHLLEPTSGTVTFNGRNLEVAKPSKLLSGASAAFGLAAVFGILMVVITGIVLSIPSGAKFALGALGGTTSLALVMAVVIVAGGVFGALSVASRRSPVRALIGAAVVLAGGAWLLGAIALAMVLLAWRQFREDDIRSLRKDMQIVFQDPFGSLNPRMLVSRIVSEGLRAYRGDLSDRYPDEAAAGGGKLTEASMEKIVGDLMKRVGLNPEHLNRFPHEFSGGQRQRICVARALALKPSFIVLDEPTSALDVSVQAQILNLLKELQHERALTYLFISHHLAVIRHMCDDVAVMYLGKIVEKATNDALFTSPTHPYTIALLSAIPSVDPETRRERIVLEGEIPSPANPPTGCRFHTRCMFAIERDELLAPLTPVEPGGRIFELTDSLAAPNTVRLFAGDTEIDPKAAAGTVAYEVDDLPARGVLIEMHVDPPAGGALTARYRRYRSPCALDEPALREFDPGHLAACHFGDEVREARRRAEAENRPVGAIVAAMRAPLPAGATATR